MRLKFNSWTIIGIITVLYIFILFNQSRWKKEGHVIEWDIIGYYGYLPAYFIYDDITLDFMDDYDGPHKFVFWPDRTPEGKKIIKYSMGLAYLYSPFFFLGHLSAKVFGYDAGGYSEPYKFFLQIGAVLYALLGFIYVRKTLLKWFSDKIIAWVVLIIGLGTNLFYYATIENTMAHIFNFALISMFIYYTVEWYESQKRWDIVKIGFLLGLITLIRPTNILIVIIFLLYGVQSWGGFGNRITLLFRNFYIIPVIGVLVLLIWIPQFLYWHKITGHFLFYSYGVSDETFDFLNSHVWKGLFGYRKGWFIYTPVMLFIIPGLFVRSMKKTTFRIATIVFLSMFVFVTFAWWCWWYAGGFGSRPMVDVYALTAIPLAAFLSELKNVKLYLIKIGIIAVLIFFTFKGCYGNFQYKHGSINFHAMTKEAYWKGFFKLKIYPGFWQLLCSPDYELAKKHIYKCDPIE